MGKVRQPDDAPDALLISPERAAELLGVSKSKVYDLMRDGTLDYALIGNRRKLKAEDVRIYIKRIFAERRRARGHFLASVI